MKLRIVQWAASHFWKWFVVSPPSMCVKHWHGFPNSWSWHLDFCPGEVPWPAGYAMLQVALYHPSPYIPHKKRRFQHPSPPSWAPECADVSPWNVVTCSPVNSSGPSYSSVPVWCMSVYLCKPCTITYLFVLARTGSSPYYPGIDCRTLSDTSPDS